MNDQAVTDQFLDDINEIIELLRERDTDGALSLIQSSIPKYPNSAELLLLTSVCSYHQNDIGRAIELCESAHKISPDGQEIVDSLAVLHVLIGSHNEGLYYAKLATTMAPHRDIPDLLPHEFSNFFEALNASRPSRHFLDGIFSYNSRSFSDAASDFERELRINPDNNAALKKLGDSFVRLYQPTDALRILNAFAERIPGDGEISALMAIAHCQLAQFDDAIPLCRQALSETPNSMNVALLVLEASMFFEGKHSEIHQEFLDAFSIRVDAAIADEDLSERSSRQQNQGEKINIALISNRLFDSDLASFLLPLLENIDKSRFTITIYQQSPTGGAVFNELKAKSENWRRIIDIDDDVVDLILDRTHTDIVIDLCGFSENSRPALIAMSQNRVVTSMFCLPNGDGMASNNLVISDAITAENDIASLRENQINVEINGGLVAINEPQLMGEVSALPAEANDHITFGGMASLKHICPETVSMWSTIMKAIPNSKLHLGYVEKISPDVKERAIALFDEVGLDGRVSLWNTDYDQRANPSYFNQVDIFLDTCTVGNVLTACHALWMGVPVITRKGKMRRSMIVASALNAAGKSQWIANSNEDAVSIIIELTRDIDVLSQIRSHMRADVQASALLDTKSYVKALEGVFEKSVLARTSDT